MKYVNLIFCALILLFSHLALPAQIKLDIDVASFHRVDGNGYCELYYSIADNSVIYNTELNYYRAAVNFKLLILKNNSPFDSLMWTQPILSDHPIKDYVADFFGIKKFVLPVGNYKLLCTASDSTNDKNNITKKIDLTVRNIEKNKLQLSDIQLALAIESERNKTSNWDESFKKNGLFVIPNPRTEILANKEPLNSYTEIYHLDKNDKKGASMVYQLFDATHTEVFKYSRDRKTQSDSFADILSIPLEALGGGVYYYKISIQSKANPDDTASVTKKIYILNSEIKPKELTPFQENYSFEKSEFSTMGPEQVETAFQQIKWITNDTEKDLFETCTTIPAKQRFLYAFWKKRNTDTTAFYNKALEDFRQRIEYANKNFKIGSMKEGWKTDRGRVLLKYDYPTTIDRVPLKAQQPAYEIWRYDEIQGGVYFVFIDFNGNGSYLLVHSTATGEIINDTWKEQYIEQLNQTPSGKYPGYR